MTIPKTFKTMRQAERFQNGLYNRYESVKLIRTPLSSEDGQYVWEVSNILPENNPN